MQTWTVDGREVTNRAGAAEYLRLAPNTVAVYASPAGRARHGWPAPIPDAVPGEEVYALADLDAFAQSRPRSGPVKDRPQPPGVPPGDLDDLLDASEYAAAIGVTRDTFKRYVELSLNAWDQEKDGYLPLPDEKEPGPVRGFVYRWKRHRVAQWTKPDMKRPSGRIAGRRPTVAEVKAILDAAPAGQRPTVREIAAELSRQLGTEVGMQVVTRRLKELRSKGGGDQPAASGSS